MSITSQLQTLSQINLYKQQDLKTYLTLSINVGDDTSQGKRASWNVVWNNEPETPKLKNTSEAWA